MWAECRGSINQMVQDLIRSRQRHVQQQQQQQQQKQE